MVGLGTVLKSRHAPYHRWLILSDPSKTGGDVLLVSLTTFDDDCEDDECVLTPEDYAPLDHDTAVAFSFKRTGPAKALNEAVKAGEFRVLDAMPEGTLARILETAARSDFLGAAHKALLGSV
jgi:hypothetical protein